MKQHLFIIFLSTICTKYWVSSESICGNWESFKAKKCIKLINEENLMTYEEAIKACILLENESQLLTVRSHEEEEYYSKYLFKKRKLVENVWLGLKKINNTFEWIDKTSVEFTNWEKGSPSYKNDRNCYAMSSDSSPTGKWVDIQCSRKLIAVCERPPTPTTNYLQSIVFETKDLLIETQKQLNNTLKEFFETRNEIKANSQQLKETEKHLSNNEKQLYKTIIELNETKEQLNVNFDKLNETEKQLIKTKLELKETKDQSKDDSLLLKETQKQLSDNEKQLNKTINELTETKKQLNTNSETLKENEKQWIITKHILNETKNYFNNTINILMEAKIQLNNNSEKIKEIQKQLLESKAELQETQRLLANNENLLNNTIKELSENKLESKSISDQWVESQNNLGKAVNELNETRQQLTNVKSQMIAYLNSFGEDFYSFTDSDGKQRALIFPLIENMRESDWNEANNTCYKYNATLVEINSKEKQSLLKSFLNRVKFQRFERFWLNARRDSPGKWKWLRSGSDLTYTNWETGEPKSFMSQRYEGWDYIWFSTNIFHMNKWLSNQKSAKYYIICEFEVDSLI